MIGRLFGRKPNDDDASRSADRLITSREPAPAVPPDTRANEARIDAALDASVDTVSLSPLAQALPAAPAASAPPVAPAAPDAPVAPSAPLADLSAGASAKAEAAFGREGGPGPWLADAFDLLLAEEQGEAPASLYGGSYGLSEADLDRIAVRVVDRMTRGAMGNNVTRIVTEVAERLVREEIERIRQSVTPPDVRP